MLKEFVKRIREARYGRDVLEAIAGAIEKAYTDSTTSVRMEVAAARGTYDSLGARLDATDTELENAYTTFVSIDNKIGELREQITSTDNVSITKRDLSLSEEVTGGGYNTQTHVMNEGTSAMLPVFSLVENSDSLVAVIYCIEYKQNDMTGYISCPAFIRKSAAEGYYATRLDCAYTGTTYGCAASGAYLNSSRAINLQDKFSFFNDNSGKKMTLIKVTAFIITK